jgi:hypothetical protein
MLLTSTPKVLKEVSETQKTEQLSLDAKREQRELANTLEYNSNHANQLLAKGDFERFYHPCCLERNCQKAQRKAFQDRIPHSLKLLQDQGSRSRIWNFL